MLSWPKGVGRREAAPSGQGGGSLGRGSGPRGPGSSFAPLALFTAWAVAASLLAMGPKVVSEMLGMTDLGLFGYLVAAYLVFSGLCQLWARRLDARHTLQSGVLALALCVLLFAGAVHGLPSWLAGLPGCWWRAMPRGRVRGQCDPDQSHRAPGQPRAAALLFYVIAWRGELGTRVAGLGERRGRPWGRAGSALRRQHPDKPLVGVGGVSAALRNPLCDRGSPIDQDDAPGIQVVHPLPQDQQGGGDALLPRQLGRGQGSPSTMAASWPNNRSMFSPALHPVAEHLGQGSGLCRCSTGWGRDPCREGHQYIPTTMMACSSSRGVGGSPAKGSRVRASSPSVNANVWLVPSAAVSATWLRVLPRLSKMVS